jgi:hypothetical protein
MDIPVRAAANLRPRTDYRDGRPSAIPSLHCTSQLKRQRTQEASGTGSNDQFAVTVEMTESVFEIYIP